MDPASDFRKQFVSYLEDRHQGHLETGSQSEVLARMDGLRAAEGYRDPTTTLPEPPAKKCLAKCLECTSCHANASWWKRFKDTVDDLLLRSNFHVCRSSLRKDGARKRNSDAPGCMDNAWKKCKARMPRPIHLCTSVDKGIGTVTMKHLEERLNTFTPLITYIFRSNTDTTSMRSGTSIKAVLLYITNYITKATLKTHTIFESICSIFRRNAEYRNGSRPTSEKARVLLTKMVNSMTAKLEIGAPMASLYLLNHPDHYTNCKFQPFYWHNYVEEVNLAWNEPLPEKRKERVPIIKRGSKFTGVSHVEDYCKRSEGLSEICLYDWICYTERYKVPGKAGDDKFPLGKERAPVHGQQSEDSIRCKGRKANLYAFLPTHPLADGYRTLYNPQRPPKIPTFLGPGLPRRDVGDREYYCLTMLTLFKPWRTGKDLKTEVETWDEAFAAYSFTDKHTEILKNLNIKYECRDASDDYFAQMRKESEAQFEPGFLEVADEDPTLVNRWMDDTNDNVLDAGEDTHLQDSLQFEQIGASQARRMAKFENMKQLLIRLQMDLPIVQDACAKEPDAPLQPTVHRSARQWDALLMDLKAQVAEKRRASVPKDRGFPSRLDDQGSTEVAIVTKVYLKQSHEPRKSRPTLRKVQRKYTLNEEQLRAFKIVTNHACSSGSEQLRMYIGGMGGTGKTRVLDALKMFFNLRKEDYRFIVVAPTGTAAALLTGYTYHSAFGINDWSEASEKSLSMIRERLKGLQYVFFDEVSMLSCRDMYRISRQLAKVTGESITPFGNLNMIFAGDFAQLPPAVGGVNASLFSQTVGLQAKALRDQEAAIGKAIWHQVDTVVILRQNMRQKTQSDEDEAFRHALENMRYCKCTPEDVAFLRTLISSNLPGRQCIASDKFKDIAVITAYHVDKDAFNKIGSRRWAAEHGQTLSHFVMEDETGSERAERTGRRTRKSNQAPETRMTPERRRVLWNQKSAACQQKIPGTLSICVGLPVMIRYNFATELCITRGQEAVVSGWIDKPTHQGMRALDTLFVELINPPQDVNIDGLPKNVVPIPQSTTTSTVMLPDDSSMYLHRSQANVIPNFAMTDYASEGKTRKVNVVDLHNLSTHYAYYTALSRSSSAANTLILQGFDPRVITRGADGALRQEFRELELLDEITLLRYQSNLPRDFDPIRSRASLIERYRSHYGYNKMPSMLHPALWWNVRDPFLPPQNEDTSWDSQPTTSPQSEIIANAKRKSESNEDGRPTKKVKTTHQRTDSQRDLTDVATPSSASQRSLLPSGRTSPITSQWEDNSCAYDAVVTALYSLSRESDIATCLTRAFRRGLLCQFERAAAECSTLNRARNYFRSSLERQFPAQFKRGALLSVNDVLDRVLSTDGPVSTLKIACTNPRCMVTDVSEKVYANSTCGIMVYPHRARSIQTFLNDTRVERDTTCCQCGHRQCSSLEILEPASILYFDLLERSPMLNLSLQISTNSHQTAYKLKSVIYHGRSHFTVRIVNEKDEVWHCDGMAQSDLATYEGDSNVITFQKRHDANAIVAIYARTTEERHTQQVESDRE